MRLSAQEVPDPLLVQKIELPNNTLVSLTYVIMGSNLEDSFYGFFRVSVLSHHIRRLTSLGVGVVRLLLSSLKHS